MHDEDIKKIAKEVAKILKEKEGPAKTFKMPGDSVNIGTAGKVFQSPLVNRGKPEGKKECFNCGEENTCGPDCQACNPLNKFSASEIKEMGADRISFCNPGSSSGQVAGMIDHTLLKANATQEEIGKLCQEARQYCFASVCVNPAYVALSARLLKGSPVKVCTVIGFPLGSTTPTIKAIEARDAMANGADEIDMVINIGALKSGNDHLVLEDIKAVREATRGKVLKVIIETAYLTKEEKIRACRLSKEANADFVKTSTGFGPTGATADDIRLMRETVGPAMGVKASGGIKDTKTAEEMIKAGATRLGTSASIAIVTGKGGGGGKY